MIVQRLPKTRSGKILRGTMRAIADGKSWKMPATIDDPAILDEITAALEKAGYPQESAAAAAPTRRRWKKAKQYSSRSRTT